MNSKAYAPTGEHLLLVDQPKKCGIIRCGAPPESRVDFVYEPALALEWARKVFMKRTFISPPASTVAEPVLTIFKCRVKAAVFVWQFFEKFEKL